MEVDDQLSARVVTSTLIEVNSKHDNNFSLKFSAIDGTFHEIYTEEGIKTFVVVGEVQGELKGNTISISGIDIMRRISEGKGEDAMRLAEYEQARKSHADLVFMDRKVSFDMVFKVDLPERFLAIVKDFDPAKRKSLQEDTKAPWVKVENDDGKLTSGFFRLLPNSWVFMFETNVYSNDILDTLVSLGSIPIPEALGYNYPLFLADKLVKYYRDKEYKGIELQLSPSRYRDFRGEVEHLRRARRFF